MLCRKRFENQLLRCRFLYSDLKSLKHPSFLPNSPQQQYGPIRTFAVKSIAETKDDPTSSNIQGTIPFHGKGLKMGQYAEVHRNFTQDDVNLFGRLSGDMNPVHFPPTTAPETIAIQQESSPSSSSQHTQPIVHGILLSSLFSNIFGTLIPGAIYRHQSLKFHNVVHVNEDIVGRVVVTKLRQIHRKGRGSNGGSGGGVLCTCDTSVIKIADVTQKVDSATAAAAITLYGNNNRDGKEEIVCISGDAQVWLPDLQLVYECREKGE